MDKGALLQRMEDQQDADTDEEEREKEMVHRKMNVEATEKETGGGFRVNYEQRMRGMDC